jgi:hypothetical protein
LIESSHPESKLSREEMTMLWISIKTENETEYLDAATFLMQDGKYYILLMDGTKREGSMNELQFFFVEPVPAD